MNTNAQTPIEALLKGLQKMEGKNGIAQAQPGSAVVSVPLITSSATSFYEKMRSILDNKEQHLIRWNTIYRTLGRLIRGSSDDVFVSRELLSELVADGLLPNNAVPIKTASKLQYILLKYRVLEERFHLPELFKIAVSEVEATLYGNRNELFVRALYETARTGVVYEDPQEGADEHFADLCLYLACRKAFLGDDESALLYGVWLKHFPEWESTVDITAEEIGQVPAVLQFALRGINDSRYRRIARRLRDQAIYFTVLRGLLEEKKDAFTDRTIPSKEIASVINNLERAQSVSVEKTGMRAFWYILITKTAIILPIEYALTRFLFPPVELFPLLVNLVFHPALLLVMTKAIRKPRRVNTDMIISGVERILAGTPMDPVRIRPARGMRTAHIISYVVVVVGVFTLSVVALGELGFTPVNILFFLVLLGVISFFAFRVRTKAKKFVLRRYEDMQPSGFWFAVVTVPFIDAGRRLSDGFRAINIFTEVMDLFIEIPFKALVKTIGIVLPVLERSVLRVFDFFISSPIAFLKRVKRSFSSFIKEHKEEID